jgi:quercetin dioxygenase-like cupin family protein
MIQQFKNRLFLAVCISMAIVSCNTSEKKAEAVKTVDSTDAVKPAADQPAVPDAVTAAPNLYAVKADTMGIRILEATYKPGDSSAWHSHPDYAIYVAQGGMATFYEKDGKSAEHEMKTGNIMVNPAEAHSVKNTGKGMVKVILFEVRRPMGTVSTDAAMDASKVAGNLYKTAKDTMGIRVLEINYKPGQSSAMHSHPDNALYVIEGGKTEFTDKDGKKTVVELKKGMTMIGPAETHSVKNIGNTTTKAILVEVTRPIK